MFVLYLYKVIFMYLEFLVYNYWLQKELYIIIYSIQIPQPVELIHSYT